MNIVSKLPHSFVPRIVASLLPRLDVSSATREQMLVFLEKKDELARLVTVSPARFFRPNPGGQLAFATYDGGARVLGLFAGNKSGKTAAGAIRFMERLLGHPVWGTPARTFEYPIPARGAVFAEDFDSHKEVTIPTLFSWFPKGTIKKTNRNSAGHVVEMTLNNGSLIHFRTYDQGSEKAEGKDWDIVWDDEPPPRDIYTAQMRGLVAKNGRLLLTATLLKEEWLWDEADKEHFAKFEGDIDENIWLDDGAKLDFLASLTDDELVVRKTGKPASLSGVIYKRFRPQDHVRTNLPAPWNCPIILGVDPHERKPLYHLYAYITPEDDIVVFDWLLVENTSTEDIKHKLRQHEEMFLSKPRLCIMDPNRGRAQQIGKVCWMDVYESFGYSVQLGDDNIHFGHTAVNDYLTGKKGPKLLFTEACQGKGGPVFQMQRYSWSNWASKKIQRDAKETPADKNKDFPDIIRYLCAAGLSYDAMWYGPDIVRMYPGWQRGQRDGIRAYV